VSDWVDLGHTIPVGGYAVHMMTVVTEDGAGRACYFQLLDARDGEVLSYLVDPALAERMAWEMHGVLNGYLDGMYDEDDVEDEEDEDL
jgi:hypothetical protein